MSTIKNYYKDFIFFFIAGSHSSKDGEHSDQEDPEFEHSIQRINKQPRDSKSGKSRYALHFFQETQEELRKRKEEACHTIEMLPLEKQEISDTYFPPEIDMPKRPSWDFSMTKEQLEAREQKYFRVS